MRVFTIGSALAAAALATDSHYEGAVIQGQPVNEEADFVSALEDLYTKASSPRVSENSYNSSFYKIMDYAVGFILGFYSPLQKRWRNLDCRAKSFDLGLAMTGYSRKFDKPM